MGLNSEANGGKRRPPPPLPPAGVASTSPPPTFGESTPAQPLSPNLATQSVPEPAPAYSPTPQPSQQRAWAGRLRNRSFS